MQRRTLVRSVFAGALAATLGTAAGCGDDKKDGGTDGGKSLEKVTYLTSFGTFGRDAYAYLAKEKGYFTAAGFDVDIQAGTGTGGAVTAIVAGKAQFSPADMTGLLLTAGGKDKTTGFTAVAAIQQRTMAGLMSLEGYGISSPKDLEGKTIADSVGSVDTLLFPTYAKLANVDASKVKFVPGKPQELFGTLIAGKVAAIGQFVVGKPTLESLAKGKKAVVLPYSDVLQDLYGNVLITSTDYAKKNPDRVKAFTAALLHGLQDAIDNPQEAGAALAKNVPTAKADGAAAELTLMAQYVKSSAAGVPVGALDAQRVQRCIALLQGAGQIDPGLQADQLITFDLVPKA